MKFKVLAGAIQGSNKKLRSVGESFEDDTPLHKIFPNKVALIGAESKAVTNVKEKETSLPAFAEGEDVSDQFKYSVEETGLQVTQIEKGYWIYDVDMLETPLNVDPLRKNQVLKFIRVNCEEGEE